VHCDHYREALSAALDGEPPGIDPAVLDRHLTSCAACRAWQGRAIALGRATRITAAESVPDLTAPILAAVSVSQQCGTARRLPSPTVWRVALVALAVGHVATGVPGLLDVGSAGAAAHAASELGAFDAALAAGFLLAAWRPAYAAGMAPLVGLAVLALTITSIASIAAGRTDITAEAPHLLDVAGVIALGSVGGGVPRLRRLAMA
jgi:predicted anti-sigma-YlaC factor YlaD